MIKTVEIGKKTYKYLVIAQFLLDSNIPKIESLQNCDDESLKNWYNQLKKELYMWFQPFIFENLKLFIRFAGINYGKLKFDILIAIDPNRDDTETYKMELIKKIYDVNSNICFIGLPPKYIIENNFSQRLYHNYLIHHLYEFNTYLRVMPSANIPDVKFTYDNGFIVSSKSYKTIPIECEFPSIHDKIKVII